MQKKINWDEVFEKYTKDKVLQKTYSEIARELGVTEKAVRKQFKKRGVTDPRKVRSPKSEGSPKRENPSDSDLPKLYPEGNTSALKHGLYAQVFWTERGQEIYKRLVESGEFPDPLFEIRLLQAKIASGEIHKVKDVLNALEIMSKLYDKAIALERNTFEKRRLVFEQERVDIMREKLELEKQKLGNEEVDVEIDIALLGDSDEDNPET